MNWIFRFFRSSLGRKFVMALTGLFLIVFLKIHLIGNSLILLNDGGESFRGFVIFMESNPFIKVMSIILMLGFIIHIVQGLDVWVINRKAKGTTYSVITTANATIFSKYMFWFGVMIFIFLVLHLSNFWFGIKISHEINDEDLYSKVIDTFKNPFYVLVYEIGIIALHMHLRHGFQSAFQSLGLNHNKWTPIIKFFGLLYSIIVPLGFFIIPLYVYFFK
jgi:succinate dehydrogenase / fumarate reductase, cytochrome b subunit